MSPEERLAELERGDNPRVVARVSSGFVVMHDTQFLRGYCLLLAHPLIEQLNDLEGESRELFLNDMANVGDAIKSATGALRINYSIYGNLDPFLHAHIAPRFGDEADLYRALPPLAYPQAIREAEEHRYDESKHGQFKRAIALRLPPYMP